MKKYIPLFLFAILYSFQTLAQGPGSGFDKEIYYDPPQNYPYIGSGFTCVYADSQRIYTLGSTERDLTSSGTSHNIPVIAAYDYTGQELWQKKLQFAAPYDQGQQNFVHELIRINPNRLVAVNFSVESNAGLDTIVRNYLYFFNNNGDSLGKVVINELNSTSTVYFNTSVEVDQQKNIVLAGYVFDQNSNPTLSYALKYDSLGNFIWKKVIFANNIGSSSLYFYRLISASDGSGYLIAGVREVADTLQNGFYLAKLDTAGNLLWQRNLPKPTPIMLPTSSVDFIDVVPNRFGSGYYFMCSAPKNLDGSLAYYCGKLSEQGDTLWTKVYETGDSGYSVQPYTLSQMSNGSLALNGYLSDFYHPVGPNALWGSSILNIDTFGAVNWFKSYQNYFCTLSTVGSFIHKAYPTPYNGLVMAGYNGSLSGIIPGCYPIDGTIARLALVDSLGRRNPTDTNYITVPVIVKTFDPPTLGVKNIVQVLPFQCYPNPAKTFFSLEWDATKAKTLDLKITDVLGKEVLQQQVSAGHAQINVQQWAVGLYSLRLFSVGKLVGSVTLVKE